MYRSNCHQRRFQGWRETVLLEWKANCRRTKGPRGWPHPSRHQHGKALKLGRLLTRVVHVPPPYERVKYGVTRFPSKPVIRLEGVVPDLLPLSYLGRCRSQTTSIPFLASLNRQTWFQEIAAYRVCKPWVFRYVKIIRIASLLRQDLNVLLHEKCRCNFINAMNIYNIFIIFIILRNILFLY